MDFSYSARTDALLETLETFMTDHVLPAEKVYDAQIAANTNKHEQPAVMRELQETARSQGLWNLFMTHDGLGAGLTNLEYAPLAEVVGRSIIGNEAINCSAPDTGNMEILAMFGTEEQKKDWLEPLLDCRIRSAFAMTEPAVASSDATNITSTIRRDGDEYVLNGRKWYTSGVLDPDCKLIIFMGKSDPDGPTYRQQSMILVPADSPGIEVLRDLPMFGFHDRLGHGDVQFTDVRVPASNMLGAEGDGFAIAQGRLGPGRMHYAMRAVGMAERALEMMCRRSLDRVAFGAPLADRGVVREWIARSRIEIDQIRLLVLKSSWMMDTRGNASARSEVAAIKVAAMEVAHKVVDRAVQTFGAAGVSDDFVLARLHAITRALQIADGPSEVHLRTIARLETKKYR
ncbi:acyl-CoA dehydrogenase family protein [Rhodococcus sp. BP-349]|uniref:acyl-CoA dehydrogenase family protein n=1 Tax=unclassified Rhodococcus (in: high G+C Gram-positive bacteria) TaxID=192944 RepID=UPI0005AC06B1|nr:MULTISPECIES: acyl-CoA dehydrogenase family protein [unclassified Rhodococcus (in: high G+C Gram-positive bacteria)]KIQ14360.1 acyl-CoA dehydrogenase [Rhodococcus sp. MEB064]KQU39083.1 acyl-CoA dehydrogenase [Rhodococcus sp. Leaf225]KQU43519.1 acyl-CoA dehydrogenase [Rhodococcus sp. Leaf258]MBY6537981.1 acyl-CoA dehydrogenase family protein [Rhodococcus sp. BP-363]MBY6542318.1 acyl-CoA dehydrogenase family protein [Rhodococcus sp. BP-369]